MGLVYVFVAIIALLRLFCWLARRDPRYLQAQADELVKLEAWSKRRMENRATKCFICETGGNCNGVRLCTTGGRSMSSSMFYALTRARFIFCAQL